MYKETVVTINRILNIVENHNEKIDELKEQVSINCTKLDKMGNKLDQLQKIGEKTQNSINELIKLKRQDN